MLNRDYTGCTTYNFYNKCCINDEYVNTMGAYPANKMSSVLTSPVATNMWTEFFLPEIVDIPDVKPNMEGIIEVRSCIEILSQRVVKTPAVVGYDAADGTFIPGYTIGNNECTNLTGRKLVIEGLLTQKVIYTAEVAEQSVHSAHFSIPFSTFIIIEPNTPLSQRFKVTPYIEDIYVCRLSERSVFKNTTIFIKASKIC